MCLMITGINWAAAQAPSIGEIVKAFQQSMATNMQSIDNLLDNNGYEYRFVSEKSDFYGGSYTVWVYSKNCKVIHEEYGNGLEYTPSKETPDASIIIIKVDGKGIYSIDVQIYSNAAFKTWVSQLKALGYRSTANGGAGNRGRDWEYVANGKPKISIWNDYSNTYVLSIRR